MVDDEDNDQQSEEEESRHDYLLRTLTEFILLDVE